jgi:hypothetical protein
MILEAGKSSRLSFSGENASARYHSARVLESTEPPALSGSPTPVRLVLELRRNLGGMVMRALLGGEFVPGGERTIFTVLVASAPFDSGVAATCASDLGSPLIPGLPIDFAPSALAGLGGAIQVDPLPSGTLRIDRAGHDLMGSSEAAFYQAAILLRAAFSASLHGADLAERLVQRLDETPADSFGA